MNILLPHAGPSVLACGAWLKNTVCVTRGDTAFVSELHGDLDCAHSRLEMEASAAFLCRGASPVAVAHDLHPDFYSTRFAQSLSLPTIAVQHHHAHIAAICAEHRVAGEVLGIALDGIGLGSDGGAWGGELLSVCGAKFERVGHLATLFMPGGDRAAKEPWRMAAAALHSLGLGEKIAARFVGQPAARTVEIMLQRELNCPATSSMGRLFDAAAGLLGVCEVQTAEAEAAIALQLQAQSYGEIAPLPRGFHIDDHGVLDFSPLLARLADCPDVALGAALFHATLAAGLAAWAARAADRRGIGVVALGGGCFHNALLRSRLSALLASDGLRVLSAVRVQPDDSSISLGQAWVALQRITEGD